jgi:diguanylate cyclase (GGDEF)-like protein
MTQGLCMFDGDNRLIVHNRRFADMFGPPVQGALADTLRVTRSPNEPELAVLFALPSGTGTPDAGGTESGAHELTDGRVIQVSRQAMPGEGWVATYEDVTERRKSQERLSYMARHDALTALPNRLRFREHLEHVLSRPRPRGDVALLYLDLDRFKAVNDTLGHAAGDDLLRQVAQRLQQLTRDGDLIARLGGDEFAVIQVDGHQPSAAATLARRLVNLLSAPFAVLGERVEIGTSIGIVLASETGSAPDELLRNADIALYRAKAAGRGTWCFFEPSMDAEIQQRRQLETDLRRALAEEQFEVFFQPIIAADQQMLSGFEALLRWRHPERGIVASGVHSTDGGNRPDQATWRLGVEQGLRRGGDLAPPPDGRGQPVGRAVHQWQPRTRRRTGACKFRSGTWPPGTGNHGVGAVAGQCFDAGHPATVARAWCANRDGRFRHRLFVAELFAPLPV